MFESHGAGGGDESRRIHFMVFGDGKFKNIDEVALENIFQYRSLRHWARRNRFDVLEFSAEGSEQREFVVVLRRHAEGERQALHRAERAVKRAEMIGVTGDFREQESRRR